MDIKKDIEDLQSGDYETGWGIFNRFRVRGAVTRTELISARNALARELIKLKEANRELTVSDYRDEHIRERLEREEDLEIAVHMLNVATTQAGIVDAQAKTYLTRSAAEKGLTLESDQEAKKITLLEEHKRNGISEGDEHARRDFKIQTPSVRSLRRNQGRLNRLIIDLHKIQQSSLLEQVKRDQIEIAQSAIEAYKAVFDAQRNRLVEAGYGEEM